MHGTLSQKLMNRLKAAKACIFHNDFTSDDVLFLDFYDAYKQQIDMRNKVQDAYTALQNEVHNKDTITVTYDLSPASVEGAVRNKLVELGWTPPALEA